MRDDLYNLPKAIAEIRNPPSPRTANVEDSGDLQGEGIEKIIVPSNIIDIYTRLEILLGLELSGDTNTSTEASNLIDDLYERRELQNEQHDRNALNKFHTQ